MVRRVIDRSAIDPSRCPLCGGDNRCASTTGEKGPCWCKSETFSFELLSRAATGRACICAKCLREHTRERDAAIAAGERFPKVI